MERNMKYLFIYTALIVFLITQGQAQAATSPYSTSSGSKSTTTTKSAPKSTAKSASSTSAAAKPATPQPAKEEPFFSNIQFGLVFISQSLDVISSNGTTTTTSSESGSGFGIYADKFIGDKYRLNGTLSYVSYDNFAIISATTAADYIVPMNANLALFGGLAAGVAGQKYTESSASDMSLALVYGAQLGGILFVSDNLMLELGYRLRLTNLETEITTAPGNTDTIEQLNEGYISFVVSF